jgi:hypothetical protein
MRRRSWRGWPGERDRGLSNAGQGQEKVNRKKNRTMLVLTLADFDGSKEHGVRFSKGFVDGHAFRSLAEVSELVLAAASDTHLTATRLVHCAQRRAPDQL